MNFRRWPRTDVGTVLVHWVAVIATVVLILTGLRFTGDDVHVLWLRGLDRQLPSENLWQRHILAGYALTGAAIVYAAYLSKARLFDRIRLDRTRFQGLFGTPRTRWSTINILLVWAFLLAALGACVTGWLAYFGTAGPVLQLHRLCTWVILGFPILHLLALLRLGGVPHLVRIFRPKRTSAAAEEIDLAHVVADLLAEKRQAEQVAQKAARQAAKRAARRAVAGKPERSN